MYFPAASVSSNVNDATPLLSVLAEYVTPLIVNLIVFPAFGAYPNPLSKVTLIIFFSVSLKV